MRRTTRSANDASSVARVEVEPDGARLVLDDGRSVCIPVLPDADGGRRVRRSMRRVLAVDLLVTTETAGARVRGIGNRFPCTVPVSLATALALVAAGTPTTIRLPRHGGTIPA